MATNGSINSLVKWRDKGKVVYGVLKLKTQGTVNQIYLYYLYHTFIHKFWNNFIATLLPRHLQKDVSLSQI